MDLQDDFFFILVKSNSLDLYELEEHQDSQFQMNLDSHSITITIEMSRSAQAKSHNS